MQASDLIVHTVAVFGASWTLGCSEILRPAREAIGKLPHSKWLSKLICCPACTGFHLGFWPTLFLFDLRQAIVIGFYACGANFLIGRMCGVIK